MSAAQVTWQAQDKSFTLDTGDVRLRFEHGRMLTMEEFSGAGLPNILGETGGSARLWSVSFRGPHGTAPIYTNELSAFLGATYDGDGNGGDVLLRWNLPLSRKGGAEVHVRIACTAGSPRLAWHLAVRLPEAWKITRLEFPVLPNLRAGVLPKAAIPTSWGVEYDLASGVDYTGAYPSWQAAMQMAALYGNGQGLYVAAHDTGARLKNLRLQAVAGTACYSIEHLPAVPEETGLDFCLPFEVVTEFFKGDYTDAARIYRKFTFETPWGNIPPVSRRGIPSWMQEADLWLRPDGSPEDNLTVTKEALAYFGGNTLVHWYRWHEIPYDTNYPEYFPTLPGFAEAIAELHATGTHVMPYINGRLWDPDSRSWQERESWTAAARQENGDCYTEVYGSLVPNSAMCPWSPLWRDTVSGLVSRLFEECGVAGVYIDQIAAARGLPCFNRDHGHPPGGGGAWHEGYRALMEQVRARVPKGGVITTEECAEPWLDQFDALIILNMPMELRSIPLFAAVYSDRTIGYAFLYFAKDEPANSLGFRMKNMRAFLYGSQLGWIQPARIMAPEVAAEAEFLRRLAATRSHARPFVTDGQFLRLLDIGGDNPLQRGTGTGAWGPNYPIREQAVSGSAWLAEGKLGVLLCNITTAEHTVEVPLPLGDAGLPEGITLNAVISGPDGETGRQSVRGSAMTLKVPAETALTISLEPDSTS